MIESVDLPKRLYAYEYQTVIEAGTCLPHLKMYLTEAARNQQVGATKKEHERRGDKLILRTFEVLLTQTNTKHHT